MRTVINEAIETGVYLPIGLVYMKNGCCEDRPVVITRSAAGAISAQCACGGWCTNGHRTATAAILEYRHMSAGRGIWDHAQLGDKIEHLENAVEAADHWEDPTQEEIDHARLLHGDD